jgi:hypothetical protein
MEKMTVYIILLDLSINSSILHCCLEADIVAITINYFTVNANWNGAAAILM